MYALCVLVENGPFEGDQEPDQDQGFEEDHQGFAEEGKWISPFAYSIEPTIIA